MLLNRALSLIITNRSLFFSRFWFSNQVTIPPPPTNCCEKGCHNCVWIKYAEKLKNLYDNPEEVEKKVLSQITDHSLKAFLTLELKTRHKKHKH